MSLTALCVCFGTALAGFAAAWWLLARADHRDQTDTASSPRKPPRDRYVAHDGYPDARTIDTDEKRRAHLDAVWAQCTVSPPYVDAILAGHEVEQTHLAELGLELDDQSPKPGP